MSLPTKIGRYHVIGHLASGGMAEVLLGKLVGPSGFERPVVIKRILDHLARDRHFVDMFLDEARIAAGIRHPNVVQVHELGEDGEDLFMVMEYLSGETLLGLTRRLDALGERLPYALAAHLAGEVCAGLQGAHELTSADGVKQHLVHRDVAPDNLFVTYDGEVKLLDFGIALVAERMAKTQTGQLKGKFPYMSPEQCAGGALDLRSDLFSLGTVLFELLTGQRLFKRKNELLTYKAIVEDPIPAPMRLDPGCPPELDRICQQALRRDPRQRPQSASAMRQELVTAARRIGGDELPEAALRQLMARLFADRIEEKGALLRSVQLGLPVGKLPAAEIEPAPERTTAPSWPAASARRGRRAMAIAIAAVALLGLGAGAYSGWRAERTRPVAATPPPVTPAQNTSVVLRVETVPAGARLHVGGEDKGLTPLALVLARGDAPVVLALTLDGYEPLEERVRPDGDQRLRLSLVKRPVVAVPKHHPAHEPAPRPPPRADPYHRFN